MNPMSKVEKLEIAVSKLADIFSEMAEVDRLLIRSNIDSNGFMTAAYDGLMWWYKELMSKYDELVKQEHKEES